MSGTVAIAVNAAPAITRETTAAFKKIGRSLTALYTLKGSTLGPVPLFQIPKWLLAVYLDIYTCRCIVFVKWFKHVIFIDLFHF